MSAAGISKKHYPIAFIITLVFCLVQSSAAFSAEKVQFVQEIKGVLQEPVDVAVTEWGDLYVLDKAKARVVVFDSEGQWKSQFGEKGYQLGELSSPQALTLSLENNLIVADTGNRRVQVFAEDGRFLYELGNAGSKEGQFKAPVSVAVDNYNFIYVADAIKKSITKFSPRGVFLEVYPLDYEPADLVFDLEQNMYVLSPQAGKIEKFSPTLKKVDEIILEMDQQNYLLKTVAMDVDLRGDIYLIEETDHSVKKLDQEERLLFSFGSRGNARGQFAKPRAITADRTGKIYIADSQNQRIQVLEILGSEKYALTGVLHQLPVVDFDMAIPAEDKIVDLSLAHGQGLYALSDRSDYILVRESVSSFLSQAEEQAADLEDPQALYVAQDGKIVVADTGNHRLQFLKSDGTYEYLFGNKGNEYGQFNALQGVVVDREGLIYVADTLNNRIQIFNNDGIYLSSFGMKSQPAEGESPAPGTFYHPKDLALDSNEQLYVLDVKNKRVQVFSRSGEFIKMIGGADDRVVQFTDPIDIAIDENNFLYVADRGDNKVKIVNPLGYLFITFGSDGHGPSYFPKLSAIEASAGKIYVADYLVDQIKVFRFNPDGIHQEEFMRQEPVVLNTDEIPEFVEVMQTVEENLPEDPVEVVEEEATLPAELSMATGLEEKIAEDVIPLEESKTKGLNIVLQNFGQEDLLFSTKYSYPLYSSGGSNEEAYNAAREEIIESAAQDLASQLQISRETLTGYLNIESEQILESGIVEITVSVPKILRTVAR